MKIETTFRPRIKPSERKMTDKNAVQLRVLTGVTAFGLVFGVSIYLLRRTAFVDALCENTLEAINHSKNLSFAADFLGYLESDMLWILFLFVLGACVYGTWLLYPTVFMKAAGFTAQACLLIQKMQPDRIGLYYLSVFPGKCLALYAILMMGQNCLYTSGEIRRIVSEQGRENKRTLSLFAMRTSVACGVIAFSDLLNTLLPMMFVHP